MTTEAATSDIKSAADGNGAETSNETVLGSETVADDAASKSEAEANPEDKAEAKKAEGEAKGKEGEKGKDEEGAPEEYDLKMPEGVEVDSSLLDGMKPWLKENNISNAKAQALADKYIEVRKAEVEQQQTQWAATQEEWVNKGRSDKEIGGEHYDASVRSARSALDRFGTPELREALNMSGMGNHPELVRLMARVGKAISEDSPAIGAGSAAKKDATSILYPDDTKGN